MDGEESPGREAAAAPSTGYKPSLTVDVSADVKDDVGSTGVTPKTAHTPHVSTNIFVAGIPSTWDENTLRERYKEFGEIISTRVVQSRHFGFVMFRKPDAAHAAINATHLTRPEPNSPTVLHVCIAMHDEGVDDEPNERIFVRGLPQWATKDHLRQCFCPYGEVVECAVLVNPLGQCKGSGFVQFSSVEEASAAVRNCDGHHIENWDQPIEVKFSETPEVRQQRQERNRNRQKSWSGSPKYRNGTGGGGSRSTMPSPFPLYPAPLSVLPSPQGIPMMGAMPFPVVHPPPPSVADTLSQPTQIVYPPPLLPPVTAGMPYFPSPSMVMLNPPPFPQKGDLHLSGVPLSEDLVRTLLQPYGAVEELRSLDREGGGYAVRMKDAARHPFVAQQLNGTLFSTGHLLAVGLYA